MKHDDRCTITNVNNDTNVIADIMEYREGKYLTVVVMGAKIRLQWNEKHKKFMGSVAGMEFESLGPRYY